MEEEKYRGKWGNKEKWKKKETEFIRKKGN